MEKHLSAVQIAHSTIRRGAEIFGLGILFRIQEYLIAWGWAPRSDLFRVDILNTIGLSMMLMSLTCWIVLLIHPKSATHSLTMSAFGIATVIALLTPPLWTTWRPRFLPWTLESYINGVHNLGAPQPWLFPIFPWTAFAFAGMGVGFAIFGHWARQHPSRTFFLAGAGGIILIYAARWLDHCPVQVYAVYDYWHTSPNFFMTRVGLLLVILSAVYAWCRWGAGQWNFSPMIQLGQTSLLVYWVHIEFVYGRFSILAKRAQDIETASLGLLLIFLSMLLLSLLRTKIKVRSAEVWTWVHRPARAG